MTTTLPKVALITGITGQDGAYLAEFLLEEGYAEWTRRGIKRRSSLFNTDWIDHLYQYPHETGRKQSIGRNSQRALRRMFPEPVQCASLIDTLRATREVECRQLPENTRLPRKIGSNRFDFNIVIVRYRP